MQEFTDLINYCYQQYTAIPPCSDCAMGNCRKDECEDCYNCLKHVHSYSNHTDHYSCKKITYNFPFKIQTKLDNSLIINFSFIPLYQDVKRK
ncbi:Uncharacterised protein [uncultured Bacteroides sp.]|nr:Uncharacterised protein [uncultured Bacteroides sp.]